MYKAKIIATNEELLDMGIDPELFPDRECICTDPPGMITIFPEGKHGITFAIPDSFLKLFCEYDVNKDLETLKRIKDALFAAKNEDGVLMIPTKMVLDKVYDILEGR